VLRIRLQRTGRKNLTTFRVVVAENHAKIKGKFVEILGHYLPCRQPKEFECKQDRVSHWISNGAVPTDSVARLLKKYCNMEGVDKFIKERVMKPSRADREKAKAEAEQKEADAKVAKEKAAEAKAAKEAEAKATEEKKDEEKSE